MTNPTTTFPFENSSNYTFDSDKIDVNNELSGQATLMLKPTSQTFEEDFADDADFIYNSSKAEFVGGVLRQKDQTPDDSIVASKFASFNANWNKAGSVTGNQNGSPSIVSNKLECHGYAQNGLYYNINNSGVGTINVKYTPNYSGSPSFNINIVSIYESGTTANRIALTHTPSSGTLRVTITDSVGSDVYLATIIGSAPGFTLGQEYEIEFAWDNLNGIIRVFINKDLQGTLSPGAWSHSTNAARLYVGASPAIYNIANGTFDDLILFSTVKHTATYVDSYTIPDTIYASSTVTLPDLSHVGVGNIISLTGFTATSETGAPKYTIELDSGGEKYWDGSAWVSSNGTYTEANDSSTVDSNISDFDADGGIDLTVRIYFTDSNTQGAIDHLDVPHDGHDGYYQDNPTLTPGLTLQSDNLVELNETTTVTGNDAVEYILVVDGTDKYYDGSNWVASTGYPQSNTITEINDHASALTISNTLKIKVVLHSDDGQTRPSISSLSVEFSYEAPDISGSIETVLVTGYIYNPDGTPDTAGTVDIKLIPKNSEYTSANTQIGDQTVTAECDSDGGWGITLIPSANIGGAQYRFTFKPTNATDYILDRTVIASNTIENTVEFENLV